MFQGGTGVCKTSAIAWLVRFQHQALRKISPTKNDMVHFTHENGQDTRHSIKGYTDNS
jgi:hypothetical protein